MSSHQPFHEYYHRQHSHNDDEQASANNRIRPSLRMSESWYPSWVSSDDDSSSLETGSGIITPQLIYEQRRILMDIEEKKKQEEGYGNEYPAFENIQQPYQPSIHSAQDRFLLQRGESSNGSITSMEEDKSILNHSVRMYMEIDESGGDAAAVLDEPSFCDDSFEQELNHDVHCNMDPFRDEEEESYPHHRIHFHPGRRPSVEDPANEITRSTHHSAQPIPIPSELPSRLPQRPTRHISQPIQATLVDEQQQQQQQQDVEALRTQMEQDLEHSKVFRKSLQEETERLRNRIMEMEEQEPKRGCCSRRMKICGWAWCLLILVGVVLVANWMVFSGKGMPFFGKEASTVTSPADASSGINVTVSPSSSPTTNSLDPATVTPTCQRPAMSTFFGGASYRTKSGQLDGRHDVRCKREMSTRMLIVLVASAASCQVECVGYLLPSDYSRQCPSNRSSPLANATTLLAAIAPMGGGGGGSHSSTPDVDFILAGDYRNEILYLGYASSDFDLACSQKLIMV